MICPKCGALSGDDWSQCVGACPMPMSPYYAEPDYDTHICELFSLEESRADVEGYDDWFPESDGTL